MTLLSIKQQLMLICPYFHCLNRRVHSKVPAEVCPGYKHKDDTILFPCIGFGPAFEYNQLGEFRDLNTARHLGSTCPRRILPGASVSEIETGHRLHIAAPVGLANLILSLTGAAHR